MKNSKLRIVVVIITLLILSIFMVRNVKKINTGAGMGDIENNNSVTKQGEERFGKPVIYLYPTKEQGVSVKLDFKGTFTCTYPEYKDGWNIIAMPDGKLKDRQGKEYSYLFWEGKFRKEKWNLEKGFVVKGSNVSEFLENKLSEIGLTAKEYNEFIVYWYPILKNNPYNLISFSEEQYENLAPLKVSPKPDSMLRVFMTYKSLTSPIKIPEQKFKSFKRIGFTVVEWGGLEAID